MKNEYTNEQILDAFYDEYLRSPSVYEFIACGGKLVNGTISELNKLLKANHYSVLINSHPKSFEVYEDGEFVFIGTALEVSEEFDISSKTVANTPINGRALKDTNLFIKPKPFIGLPELGICIKEK